MSREPQAYVADMLERARRVREYAHDLMVTGPRPLVKPETAKERSGRPCIRGMRITVYDTLSSLAAGMSHEQILADFPYLVEEDILASLAFAADRERRTLRTT